MDLYFSKDEQVTFLEKRGYIQTTIKTWKIFSVYHNDTETEYIDIIGMIKPDEKLPLDEDGQMRKDEAEFYSIESTFKRELKKVLLAL